MIDVQSSTWRAIQAWLEKDLAATREYNDRELDVAGTALVRGRIAALKDLLQLPERLERERQLRESTAGAHQAPTFMNPSDYS